MERDIMMLIAKHLDYQDIINLCKIKTGLCDRYFWKDILKAKYKKFNQNLDPRKSLLRETILELKERLERSKIGTNKWVKIQKVLRELLISSLPAADYKGILISVDGNKNELILQILSGIRDGELVMGNFVVFQSEKTDWGFFWDPELVDINREVIADNLTKMGIYEKYLELPVAFRQLCEELFLLRTRKSQEFIFDILFPEFKDIYWSKLRWTQE